MRYQRGSNVTMLDFCAADEGTAPESKIGATGKRGRGAHQAGACLSWSNREDTRDAPAAGAALEE